METEEKNAPDDQTPQPDCGSLLIYPNPDKGGTRPSGDGPWMPKWPFRLLLSGPPGSGKRNMLLNLVFRLAPPPSAIHVCHYDPTTKEYEELETIGVPVYMYSPDDIVTVENLVNPDAPPIGDSSTEPLEAALAAEALACGGGAAEEMWAFGQSLAGGPLLPFGSAGGSRQPTEPVMPPEPAVTEKNGLGGYPLVILDELTTDVLPATQQMRLERLLNYGSTHKNTAVIASIQNITSIPPKARRGFNQFCLWRSPDENATALAATRAGVPTGMLKELFGLCENPHDCIWVDTDQPHDSQWRYRLNFLTPIRAVEAVSFSDYA